MIAKLTITQRVLMPKESEETEMKKDLEWAKQEIYSLEIEGDSRVRLLEVLNVLNEVDEPEVLSQEWLDKHLFSLGDEYLWKEAVPVDDLQNLLVPRQELPVIPKFVAEWIEDNKKQNKSIVFAIGHIYDENEIGKSPTEKENRIFQWMELADNDELFARAWLAYPDVEVEEEQKYYVMNNDNRMMLVRMMDGKTITEADPFKLEDMYEVEKKSHRLTEQEIKDYDERYWPFAAKVEEMEE